MLLSGQVGPEQVSDGSFQPMRLGKAGDAIVSELHGRLYEQCYRGALYAFGGVSTALAAANATATGLTSSAQPVIGVWNPLGSGKNLVILNISVMLTVQAVSTVSPASFVYVSAINQSAISTGSAPISRNGLIASGSVAKAFAFGTALTGLSGSLTNTAIPLNVATVAFAQPASGQVAGLFSQPSIENVDGSWIVPPGGVLGVMGTTSTTTVSCQSSILWEEVLI